jgi:hypothetical protein
MPSELKIKDSDSPEPSSQPPKVMLFELNPVLEPSLVEEILERELMELVM